MSDFFKLVKTVLVETSFQDPLPKFKIGFADESNICMFIPKTQELLDKAKMLMPEFQTDAKTFNENNFKGIGKYPSDYLYNCVSIIKKHDTVKIGTGSRFPIQIETNQCIFLIAPRVSTE